MTIHRDCFKLAEEFRRWLEIEAKQIPVPIRALLPQLQSSWLQEKIEETESFCELAKKLLQERQALPDSQGNSLYSEGILNAHQGAIYWATGELYRAEVSLRLAADQFAKSGVGAFNASVVQMALGDIWECLDKPDAALKAYQQSLYYFEHWFSSNPRPSKPRYFHEAVEEKFKRLCYKMCRGASGGFDADTSTTSASSPKSTLQDAKELRTFPVMGLASAGASVLTSDKIDGYGVTDTITVNRDLYNIHPLKADKDFRIRFHHDYVISPVRGNSMNLAGIQNVDYVLLERPSDGSPDPKNGDIVLAVVYDQEGAGESGMILKTLILRKIWGVANGIMVEHVPKTVQDPSLVYFYGQFKDTRWPNVNKTVASKLFAQFATPEMGVLSTIICQVICYPPFFAQN